MKMRIPVAPIGVIVHKPKRGKGAYTRKAKHTKKVSVCFASQV